MVIWVAIAAGVVFALIVLAAGWLGLFGKYRDAYGDPVYRKRYGLRWKPVDEGGHPVKVVRLRGQLRWFIIFMLLVGVPATIDAVAGFISHPNIIDAALLLLISWTAASLQRLWRRTPVEYMTKGQGTPH